MAQHSPNMQAVLAYLRQKGIPRPYIDAIRTAILTDCIQQSNDMKMDRMFTAGALALYNTFGFSQVRISRFLTEWDRIIGSVGEEVDLYWSDIARELDEKTGVIVRTRDTDDAIMVEYRGMTEERWAEIKRQEEERKHGKDDADL